MKNMALVVSACVEWRWWVDQLYLLFCDCQVGLVVLTSLYVTTTMLLMKMKLSGWVLL